MKKLILVTFIVVLVLPNLFSTGAAESDEAESIQLRFQHMGSANHPWQIGAEYIAKRLAEKSNGKMTMNIYPAGVLCGRNWKVNVEQVQTGIVDMLVEWNGAFSNLIPELLINHTPFLYDDIDHQMRLLKTKPEILWKYLRKMEDLDLYPIGVWPRPSRQHINSKRLIHSPEDLKGITLRVPGVNFFVKVVENLGMSAIPLASGEIYTAIQMGRVDGEDNSIGTVYDFKTFEVAKYMTIWDYIPDFAILAMSKKKFNSLSSENQELILKVVEEAGQVVYETEKRLQEEAIEKMKKAGVQFVFLTNEEKTPFKKLIEPNIEIIKEIVGEKDFNSFMKAVEKARD